MKNPALLVAALLFLGLAACQPDADRADAGADTLHVVPDMPPLETHADSMAMQVYEAFGSPAAWASLHYLRFNFGMSRDGGEKQVFAKHLWDRMSGDYRVEWNRGADSTYVALFNTNTRQGQAYLNGTALDTAASAEAVRQAYGRFINDTYWLMAPVKMLDSGVERTYMPDSSDAALGVIKLAFHDVGLTPGDQYWIYVDKGTGRVTRWRFLLQSGREGAYDWTGYETFDTPAGSILFATQKKQVGAPTVLYTDAIAVPAEVPAEAFTDPNPRL